MAKTTKNQSRQKNATAAKLVRKSKEQIAAAMSDDNLLAMLRRKRMTIAELCQATGAAEKKIEKALHELQKRGVLVYQFGDQWGLEKAPKSSDDRHVYKSRRDGTYLFGFASDAHMASKYERADVLNDLYDKFASAGVDCVFNSGNWIDGEARFNMHDLKVHGMDAQCEYLADNFPRREGIVTYAVAGDDHEGWYGQREGIDIGKHAAAIMRDAGRNDWVHIGFMEAFVRLQHATSGKHAELLVMHPGGGSAYAISYRPQKIVESFAGGEKPAVLLIGHYHKLSYNLVRNVHAVQSGAQQDQTPFMRKKGIDAHVGGGICKLTQDSDTGAIVGCAVEFFVYYNTGYYNHRWSHAGDAALPDRGV